MKYIEKMLEKEQQELAIIIRNARKRLQGAPEGNIRIVRRKNRTEYYYKTGEKGAKKNGTYIKNSERDLVQRIIQKQYDESVIAYAEERMQSIKRFIKAYGKTNLGRVFQKLNSDRKAFVANPILSDEEYIKQWECTPYEGNTNYEIKGEIVTEKGEYVRSKSEKIIADKLYMLGIPYRYECPLVMDNGVIVYPDFTILKVDTREEVYLEHFGMMNDLRYVERAMHKLDMYARNGIYIGVNLWLTFETQDNPLNTRGLDEMLKQIFVV